MKLLQQPHRFVQALCAFLLLLLSFTFSLQRIAAQTTPFAPAFQDSVKLHKMLDQYEVQFRQHLKSLPSPNRSDLEKIYKQRWENIKEKFDTKEIHTDPAAQQYLDALVAELVRNNPTLQGKTFQCFFSRAGNPNASYLGEGIILVNMGLFYRLQDESQAAFILAHELAHFLLQHSDNSIRKYVATLNSEEVQKQLRAIKGSEYKKREQLEKLVKGVTFNTRRHSRDHETQADSLAVEIVRHTRFDVSGALSTLALLDTIDRDTLQTAACLQNTFNAKDYPFQKKWIAKEEGLLGGHAHLTDQQEMEDSLKTHPNCAQRMKLLEPLVLSYKKTSAAKFLNNAASFETWKLNFRYELIAYAFQSGYYTRSLYYTLHMLQQNPNDPYLVTHTGKLFNSFFASQKAHTLGKYIDMPSPGYPSGYNLLLQFVQNLYREDFASISYHFLKAYQSQFKNYEPYREAYSNSIQIAQR